MTRINKNVMVLLGIIILLILISLITYSIDSNLVEDNKNPRFIIHTTVINDGGSKVYYGLGYQIISWNKLGKNTNTILKGVEKHYILGFTDPIKGPNTKLKEMEDKNE